MMYQIKQLLLKVREMAVFISTYLNKIDKKGRVSVPSAFRSILANENFSGIIAYPSFVHECVEACGMKRIEKLYTAIDAMDPYSEERDAFAAAILGQSQQLAFDGDGRILLPESLIETANLKDQAVFVGKGQTFEIWQPQIYEKYSAKAREIAKQNRGRLTLTNA